MFQKAALWGVFGYVFREELRDIFGEFLTFAKSKYVYQIIIDIEQSPKSAFAIKQTIENSNNYISCFVCQDAHPKPVYKISNGIYIFGRFPNQYWRHSKLFVNVTDDKIYISCTIWESFECIKQFYEDAYNLYCSPDEVVAFFSSKEGEWGFPHLRRPRNFQNMRFTKEMMEIINDVKDWVNNENYYLDRGLPYKRGYLLHGKPGTGKSTIIEVIASNYGMDIYLLNLNGINMDDSSVINLIGSAPPNSIIVIEEIEKQIELLDKNINNLVSIGGLLTAIDGCMRMPHSSLLFITCNSLNFIEDQKNDPLIRPGRIDVIKEFKNKLIIN